MSYKYKRASKDKNHDQIKFGLIRCGFSVGDAAALGGSFPDLIVADRRSVVLMEIKTDDPDAYLYIGQLQYLAEWKNHSAFVNSFERARQVMSDPDKYCLTEKQKLAILKFCYAFEQDSKAEKPKVRVTTFDRAMEKILGERLG